MSTIKDPKKLCILNVKDSQSDDEIRQLCESLGKLVHFSRPPNKKSLAFPLYMTESDAQTAKDSLVAEGYRVEYANRAEKTNGKTNGFGSPNNNVFRDRPTTAEDGSMASSVSDNRPYGICFRCGDKAYLTCGRCDEFYCSEECQSSDWLKHKRVCFPMPKLVPCKSTQNLRSSQANIDTLPGIEKYKSMNAIAASPIDAPDGGPKPISRAPVQSPSHTPPQSPITVNVKPKPASASVEVTIAPTSDPLPSNTNAMPVEEATEELPPSNRSVRSGRDMLRARIAAGSVTNGEAAKVTSQPTQNGTIEETIPNGAEVVITFAKSPTTLYIRSTAKNDEYTALLGSIEEASKTAPKLSAFPERSDVVMAPYDGFYYRAMVIKGDKKEGLVNVGFLDFGNQAEVAFSCLRVLPDQFKEHRRYTVMVNLKGIRNDLNEAELQVLTKHLESLVDLGKPMIVKGENAEISKRDSIELFDVITNESLSEHLNGLVGKRFFLKDLIVKTVDATDVEFMILESGRIRDNFVTCILKDDVEAFMCEDGPIQSYGASVQNAPAYHPKVKELCLVKLKDGDDDAWYRAIYQQELVDDMCQVYAYDYGRTENVEQNKIRALTADLITNMITFVARFKGEMTKELRDKALQNNGKAFAKKIEYDGDMHIIKLE